MDPSMVDTLHLQAPAETVWLNLAPKTAAWAFQVFLFGVTLPLYFHHRKSRSWEDSRTRYRVMVTTVVILNTIQSILNTFEVVRFASSQQRDFNGLVRWSWLDFLPPWPQLFICVIVTSYLARRSVLVVQYRPAKYLLTALLTLLISGVAIGSTVLFVDGLDSVQGLSRLGGFTSNDGFALYSCCSAFTDVTISITLGIALGREISGFSTRTDNLLRTIIWIGARTAATTAIFAAAGAVLDFVLPWGSPEATIGWSFVLSLPSLYTFRLLTVCASREKLCTPASSRRTTSRSRSRFSAALHGLKDTLPIDQITVKLETFRHVEDDRGKIVSTGPISKHIEEAQERIEDGHRGDAIV